MPHSPANGDQQMGKREEAVEVQKIKIIPK
jgi:hypothetical protein